MTRTYVYVKQQAFMCDESLKLLYNQKWMHFGNILKMHSFEVLHKWKSKLMRFSNKQVQEMLIYSQGSISPFSFDPSCTWELSHHLMQWKFGWIQGFRILRNLKVKLNLQFDLGRELKATLSHERILYWNLLFQIYSLKPILMFQDLLLKDFILETYRKIWNCCSLIQISDLLFKQLIHFQHQGLLKLKPLQDNCIDRDDAINIPQDHHLSHDLTWLDSSVLVLAYLWCSLNKLDLAF